MLLEAQRDQVHRIVTAGLRPAFPTVEGLPLVAGSPAAVGLVNAALRAAFPTAEGLPPVVGSVVGFIVKTFGLQ